MSETAEQVAHPIAPVYHGILEMIGNTPMLEMSRLDTGACRLFVKLESLNPGSSIKDRIAISMIRQAESDGHIKPGGRIIEATAGNTGIGLALVARQRGYALTVVVPDKMGEGKIAHLRAMGAEIIITRSDVQKGHPEYYQDIAAALAERTPNSFFINQFANEANVQAHYETTGPEIWSQMDGEIDAFVSGIGSGGTLMGVGRYLRERNPDIAIILADPAGSILAPLVNEGRHVEPGEWLVEGVGEDFVPPITDLDLIDRAYSIDDQTAFETARELLEVEGLLAGSSTGTLVGAALAWCREQEEPKRVVTLAADHGSKYLPLMFNDFWMIDQGFIDRPSRGDLRDLIARRHSLKEDYTLTPATPLSQAVKVMRLYDISQMAVLDEHDRVVGILDESDVLMAMVNNPDGHDKPIETFMTSRLRTISPKAPVEELLPIFRDDLVAIVADEDRFYGLITRIDLVNDLRKRMRR